MPVKQRIRHNARPAEQQAGFIKGKAPHRRANAHKVIRKWPYFRAILLYVACAILLVCSILIAGYGVIEKNPKIIYAGIAVFGVWVLFRLFYYFARKVTTCPLCRASHLLDGRSSKHKKAYKVFPLSYSSTAIVTATTCMCVRCMHCGVTFDLTKKYR